jgi:hypothetical protein
MAKTFNPDDNRDYRTLNVAGKVVIITRDSGNIGASNYYYGNNTVIHHEMIDLPHHEFEPSIFYMKNDKRYETKPTLPKAYKCTCGDYSLKPLENGLRHQAIIECQCENCRAKMFIEIPNIQKNTKPTVL